MSTSDHQKQVQPYHTHRNVRFQAIPVSPSETDTPLQVVCFFDQTKNRTLGGGTALVNAKLGGLIEAVRADDLFRGELFETLLLTPERTHLPARRLLLIGLGDPDRLDLAALGVVGRVAVREAIKLGVPGFCFAPSLKDAGVSTFPAADVSTALVHGMTAALAAAEALTDRGLAPAHALAEIVLLAGAQHLENSQAGLRAALAGSQSASA